MWKNKCININTKYLEINQLFGFLASYLYSVELSYFIHIWSGGGRSKGNNFTTQIRSSYADLFSMFCTT